MEEKKKSNAGLIILVVILLLACAGMGAFIFINKDKLTAKENTTTTVKSDKKDTKEKTETNTDKKDTKEETETNTDMFKDETIHAYYYETKQEGTVKYFMTLGNMSKDNNRGYFTIRYVSVFDSGGEAPLSSGYYDIKDGKLKLSVGPYSDSNDESIIETVFKQLSANLEVDPEKDWRDAPNSPSYYKMYQTSYNENELIIGNKTFYKVK